MIHDFDEFCTWAYVIISDVYEAQAATHPGPPAECSDAELITMAIVGECCQWHQETELISRWRQHRHLFPRQPERTRFSRRRRGGMLAINALRQALLQVLDLAADTSCILDSLPVPVVQFYHAPTPHTNGHVIRPHLANVPQKSKRFMGISSICSSRLGASFVILNWHQPTNPIW